MLKAIIIFPPVSDIAGTCQPEAEAGPGLSKELWLAV